MLHVDWEHEEERGMEKRGNKKGRKGVRKEREKHRREMLSYSAIISQQPSPRANSLLGINNVLAELLRACYLD